MPVPVSPCKNGSSQGMDVPAPEPEVQTVQESFRAPSSPPRPREEEGEIADPDVVAGYQDCLKETLRFCELLPAVVCSFSLTIIFDILNSGIV